MVALCLIAIGAPLLAPHDPAVQFRDGLSPDGQPVGFSRQFLLGTDRLGRDELSRLLYGARVSLLVAVGGNLVAAFLGILIGGVAGISGSKSQAVLMRGIDVVLSFPILLLALALLAVVTPNTPLLVLLIGVSFGAYLSRLVFSHVVSLREREFILAARSAGVRTPTILTRHILPHLLPTALVFLTLGIASAIQLEAVLSYVGIGVQPPTASWGNMISESQGYISTAPRLILFPGIAIVLATLAFSLLGDFLRDALDPTFERRGRVPPLVRGTR